MFSCFASVSLPDPKRCRFPARSFDPVLRDWRSIEVIDGHTDVVHAVMEPKIFPAFIKPRDFCLARYWRRDQDGAYCKTYRLRFSLLQVSDDRR